MQNDQDIIEHKDRIYTLLRNSADAFKSEKEDIAYRFALVLLKSGEDKEALTVLNDFLPSEEYLKKACEQGDMIKAQAKLEDFNNKLEAVKNRTLSSDDAIYFINHMLEYAEIIKPILNISRPTLSKYRNKLLALMIICCEKLQLPKMKKDLIEFVLKNTTYLQK